MRAQQPGAPRDTATLFQRAISVGLEAQARSGLGMAGSCITVTKAAEAELKALGGSKFRVYAHDAGVCFFDDPGLHHFLVVDAPDFRFYLLDGTYRQFENTTVGLALKRSPAGRDLARELLVRGYAELDDARATLYAVALRQGKPLGRRVGVYDLLRSTRINRWG